MVNAGTLRIGNGSASSGLSDSAAVRIASGAVLELSFSGTEVVDALWLGGVRQAAGVYGAADPSGLLSGTGTLTVLHGPPVSDYETWRLAHGLAIGSEGGDDDADGVSNFAEYGFGLNPKQPASTQAMVVPLEKSTGRFTYSRRATPARTGLEYRCESSTDLATGWQPFDPKAETSNGGTEVEEITIDLPDALLEEPRLFIRVRVRKP